MNVTLESYPSRQRNVFSRIIDDEAVLVLPQKGEVKVVNEVGARIWEIIDGTHSTNQIAEIICSEYQVERENAEQDVIEFLNLLFGHGIITISNKPDQSLGS